MLFANYLGTHLFTHLKKCILFITSEYLYIYITSCKFQITYLFNEFINNILIM